MDPTSPGSINFLPLLAFIFNALLALISLAFATALRSYSIFRNLAAFYCIGSICFLGYTLYPVQTSPEAIVFWYRIEIIGLTWLPTVWMWTTLNLTDRKPGRLLGFTAGISVLLTLILLFIDHPTIMGDPIYYDPYTKALRPPSIITRPTIFFYVIIFSFLATCLLGGGRGKGFSVSNLGRPISWFMLFLFITGTHDALAVLQMIKPVFGHFYLWIGSICFSSSLVVSVALYMRDVEDRLINSEDRLRALIRSSHDPILSMDLDRIILDTNPAIEKVIGYDRRELKGRSTRFLHLSEEHFTDFGRTIYPQVTRDGSWRGRWPYRHKDGRTMITDTAISAIKSESGRNIGYLAMVRDVTEQDEHERRLKRQNQYLEALHRTTVGLIERKDPDSLLLSIVTSAAELMETPHVWIVIKNEAGDRLIARFGIGLYEALIGIEIEPGEGISGLVWESNDRVVVDFFRDFPKQVNNELDTLSAMAGVPLYSGEEFIGVLGVGREIGEPGFAEDEMELLTRLAQLASITLDNANSYSRISRELAERKRAEEARRESERRYRDLFDSVSDLIYTQDLEGRFITLNKAAAATFGYPREYFIGKTPEEFMKPEHRELFLIEYLDRVRTEGVCEGVSLYYDRWGKKSYFEYKTVLVKPKLGKPYISGVGRNVTEKITAARKLKGLQAQLAQAQKLEAVGTLAGGVAHDFNNILQAFQGYLDLMEIESQKNARLREHLPEIRRVVERATGLIRGLMTFSRKEKPDLVPVELNQEVVSTVKVLERIIPKMIEIKTDLDPDLALVKGSPNQLEQILMNLGGNARDAMTDGGTLTLQTRNVTLGQSHTDRHLDARAGDYVEMTVSDTGQGMDRETLDHMYEPFFTTKEVGKGTGLGLSSVYGIVQEHRGHLRCDSAPGQGTVFHIYLPVHKGKKPDPVEERRDPVTAGGTEVILVVDDEDAVRSLGRDLLSNKGYEVYTAVSGEEAVSLYEEIGESIDLVILDLSMPGMGGKKCLERLLELDPKVKSIIASGYSGRDQAQKAEKAGAMGFLAKPYRISDLLATVRRVLTKTP